jgi:hypothetical protein
MSALREAIVLPLLFLTVTLLAGALIGTDITLAPPSLFALVLATMLIAALVRGGALVPASLLDGSRSRLANANGAIVVGALFAATAQVLAMLTPRAGLPLFFVDVLLFVLLLNTLVVQPDRRRLLRSLAITLGSALILKFVVLAAVSDPTGSRTSRVLVALFDAATFGTIAQEPQAPAAGYVAFFTAALYLVGLMLLAPPARFRAELETAPRMQSLRQHERREANQERG